MDKFENRLQEKFKVAAIQFCPNEEKEENLRLISRFIDTAVENDADIVVLPEMFNCCGHGEVMIENAEHIPGYTTNFLSD